ncbi:MAG TPA: hypothetical protein VK610_06200 [Rhodothermales bacterium]|nr:hypothetical protein [Rhodothermales bacterium]
MRPTNLLAALALAALIGAAPVAAQVASAFPQDGRPDLPFASTLGMGDAVTAVPSMDAAFFTNPALLSQLAAGRARIQFLGAGAEAGGNIFDLYSFYQDELGPAIEEGLDGICTNDDARCEALYEQALEIGRRPSTLGATVLGPAVQMAVGPVTSMQIGAFVTSHARATLSDGGAGVPLLDLYDQTDLLVPVGASVRVPGSPLAVGVQATYTRRWVTGKFAFIDELNPDAEALYVLSGGGITFDAGLHARDVGLPGLDFGLAVHRLAGGAFTYTYDRRIEIEGEGFADDEAEIAALEERFNERDSGAQMRAGAAYRLPAALLAATGVLHDVTISADWVGASTSSYDQTTLAKLRIGAQAGVGPLALRAGLSQGYPALGAGINTRAFRLDYAFFGIEEGRRAGQLRRGAHLLQFRFGLF